MYLVNEQGGRRRHAVAWQSKGPPSGRSCAGCCARCRCCWQAQMPSLPCISGTRMQPRNTAAKNMGNPSCSRPVNTVGSDIDTSSDVQRLTTTRMEDAQVGTIEAQPAASRAPASETRSRLQCSRGVKDTRLWDPPSLESAHMLFSQAYATKVLLSRGFAAEANWPTNSH